MWRLPTVRAHGWANHRPRRASRARARRYVARQASVARRPELAAARSRRPARLSVRRLRSLDDRFTLVYEGPPEGPASCSKRNRPERPCRYRDIILRWRNLWSGTSRLRSRPGFSGARGDTDAAWRKGQGNPSQRGARRGYPLRAASAAKSLRCSHPLASRGHCEPPLATPLSRPHRPVIVLIRKSFRRSCARRRIARSSSCSMISRAVRSGQPRSPCSRSDSGCRFYREAAALVPDAGVRHGDRGKSRTGLPSSIWRPPSTPPI